MIGRVVTHRHAFSTWFFQLPCLPIEPLGGLLTRWYIVTARINHKCRRGDETRRWGWLDHLCDLCDFWRRLTDRLSAGPGRNFGPCRPPHRRVRVRRLAEIDRLQWPRGCWSNFEILFLNFSKKILLVVGVRKVVCGNSCTNGRLNGIPTFLFIFYQKALRWLSF